MSHRPNGTRKYRCWVCGQMYTRSNYMIRRGVKTADGLCLDDTHQISCYRKRKEESKCSAKRE